MILTIGALVVLNSLTVQATREATARSSISWVQAERSVLIRLDTPDLPLLEWNSEEQEFFRTHEPSAIVLNFTVSTNSSQLLLQDQPILPLPNPNYPPRLSAYQVPASIFSPYNALLDPDAKYQLLHLDYERFVDLRDDPDIHYFNWHPTLALNILGVGIGDKDLTLLPSVMQRVLKIKLKDANSIGLYNAKWTIEDIKFAERGRDFEFRAPVDLPPCTLRSFRCHDSSPGNDPPWYRYIYRHNFDEFGKIGSLRHNVMERWSFIYGTLGMWRIVLGVVFIAGLVLFPPLRALGHLMKRDFSKRLARYRALRQEEAYWMEADEDIEVGDYFRETGWSDQLMERRRRRSSVEITILNVPVPEEENPLPPLPTVLIDIEDSDDDGA